jgi:hypothetical protein
LTSPTPRPSRVVPPQWAPAEPSRELRIEWHPTTPDDLDEGLGVQPQCMGGGIIGKAAARRIWREMFSHPAFFSAVVICDPTIGGCRIGAFGAAAFVSSEFVEAEIAHPRPGVNDRFMEQLAEGRNVLLDDEGIAEANSTAGLETLTLYGSWPPGAEIEKRFSLLTTSFLHLISGFRIKRLLWEAVGDTERRFARQAGIHRILAEFPELNRDLVMVDPESAAQVPASAAQAIFQFRQPLLALAKSEQTLLLAALKGLTDEELTRSLGLTASAVKARWRSVFARMAAALPELADRFQSEEVRGRQKRHRVIEYMREHPEELRPWVRQRQKNRTFENRTYLIDR